MTGSTTRISKLGYGEIEQFLRDLTEEGFGGHHIRDFKDDKPAFRQWVQDGIALIEGRWATLPIHTPGKAWTQIEGTIVWTCQRDVNSKFTEEDGAEILEIWISTVPEPGLLRAGRLVNLHPRKWKSVHGVQMRRAGHSNIEVRVPAQHDVPVAIDEPDEWQPVWSAQLGRGVLVSLGSRMEATVAEKNHSCFVCQGNATLVVELVYCGNARREGQLLHLYGEGWHSATPDMQIRTVNDTKNAIEVRDRKH